MPKYITSQSRIIYEEEVRKLYDWAPNPDASLFIALMWVTGARPAEVLSITGADVGIDETTIKLRMPNLKQKMTTKKFMETHRVVPIQRGSFWAEEIVKLLSTRQPERKVLERTHGRYVQLIAKMSKDLLGVSLSPYHLRHSSTTLMLKNRLTVPEVMAIQGRASSQSLSCYTHATPAKIDMGEQDRSKQL